MLNDLDQALSRLSLMRLDPRLSGLESVLGEALALKREQVRLAGLMRPIGYGSVGLALVIGLTAGGLATTRIDPATRSPDPFDVSSGLAPSDLLDTGR